MGKLGLAERRMAMLMIGLFAVFVLGYMVHASRDSMNIYDMIEAHDVGRVIQIAAAHPDVLSQSDTWKRTPLLYAVQENQIDTAKELLRMGANPNCANANGISPLIAAVQRKNAIMVEALVASGADINQADKVGNTPLLWACKRKDTEIASYLLLRGANPALSNSHHETALSMADTMPDPFREIVTFAAAAFLKASNESGVAHAAEAVAPEAEGLIEIEPTPDRYIIGSRGSLIQIQEFTDFECPYCQESATALADAIKEIGADVGLVILHHPLSSHPNALPAAKYFEQLMAQDKIKAYIFYNELMSSPLRVPESSKVYASLAANDKQSVNEEKISSIIDADTALALKHGLKGVPAFVINGKLYKGYIDKGQFMAIMRDIKASAQ